jgi:hypothetical protein
MPSSKGSSTSTLLHELMTRLRNLEMSKGSKIILSHVSGERMKWQGTDSLSRRNLLEGVMKGQDMLTYVPLHQTATKRSPKLLGWIKSWGLSLQENVDFEVLLPDTWFTWGHDMIGGTVAKNGMYYPQYKKGVYLWNPRQVLLTLLEKRSGKLKLRDMILLTSFSAPACSPYTGERTFTALLIWFLKYLLVVIIGLRTCMNH